MADFSDARFEDDHGSSWKSGRRAKKRLLLSGMDAGGGLSVLLRQSATTKSRTGAIIGHSELLIRFVFFARLFIIIGQLYFRFLCLFLNLILTLRVRLLSLLNLRFPVHHCTFHFNSNLNTIKHTFFFNEFEFVLTKKVNSSQSMFSFSTFILLLFHLHFTIALVFFIHFITKPEIGLVFIS